MTCIIVDKYLRDKKSLLIASVHDSVVLDVHPDEIHEVAPTVLYIMENLPIDFLKFNWKGQENVQYPITAEAEIGSNYADIYEYDKGEIESFKTIQGFTEYNKAKSYVEDAHDSKVITEEQKEAGLDRVEELKPEYQKK